MELRGVVPSVVGDIESFDFAAEQAKMSPDAGKVFAVWLGMTDRRLDLAAENTGQRALLVRQWSTKYGWRELARRYDLAVSNQLMVQLRSTLVVEGFKSIQTAIGIRDSLGAKNNDRLKAAIWIASLTGIGAQLAAGDGPTGGGVNADDLRRLATSGDPEDLKRLVRLTTGGGE